ncbi:Helix-turn-helix domain-containing protein [Mariniphaga anaerophila]|uniref:Helix-turn-helix domain-containing protein n=1 Tax=Mariniphaga anaerophila TaxID=1484053 RepID=A0A1M5CEL3_9BACT|nr:helix-turn-helix domain-containing protein [Mariniphaga anaerophila]SHF53141.1 Helix-turn-helix domain-containing protein [Mariniphaga anaerophila]
MEKERVLIATDSTTLKNVLNEILKSNTDTKTVPGIEKDKLTKKQASELAGISIPTLNKQIKAGKFKVYSIGVKKYLLKSEMEKALRTSNI